MKNILIVCLLSLNVVSGYSCKKNTIKDNTGLINRNDSAIVNISTDKAAYLPGSQVVFKINKNLPAGTNIIYKYLNKEVDRQTLNGSTWKWTAPMQDFTGYIVELSGNENGKDKIYGCIGVDVSSDPARFPRNGFLSEYGQMSSEEINSVMSYLNRLHMNWIQFQDWEFKHHMPLAGTAANPAASWKDIANRTNYKSTVQGYIQSAKSFNMKTLSYNMIYGALNDAGADGVSAEWYMYQDQQHNNKQVISLPQPPFKSDIFFLDPSNTGWQDYIANKTKEAFEVYDFDGYQVDQFGNLNKNLYSYSGNLINVEATFKPFLEAMKTQMPTKRLVMNAVNQYGQQLSISKSPVDFLYTEVWAPNEGYKDLATIIQNNDSWSNDLKKTVLSAYMDYNLAGNPGYFNTPGVLLTDAVIFSFGGAHLELGDHMLGKEYFPNNNLQMRDDLKTDMVHYYDFLTGYQNLLRDGGTFNNPVVTSVDKKIKINNWPPAMGGVSVIGKEIDNKQVIHFINFANASSLQWRDADGKQPLPATFTECQLNFQTSNKIKNIWFASPDINAGASQNISFNEFDGGITFTLPSLQYWDMLVIEYE